MMNYKTAVSLLTLLLIIAPHPLKPDTYTYRQELEEFKQSTPYKAMFDKYMPTSLSFIQRDIQNYKSLTFFQRFVLFLDLHCDSIVVTPDTLPHLYAYAENICIKAGIQMPVIFITRRKNALQCICFKNILYLGSILTGSILIGQELIYETADDELEAVIAHEIGHIKHNHTSRGQLTHLIASLPLTFYVQYIISKLSELERLALDGKLSVEERNKEASQYVMPLIIATCVTPLLAIFFINKRYEQEADQFAYQDMNKGPGIIKFFTHLQEIEQAQDNEFDRTKDMIKDHKNTFGLFLYTRFMASYYMAKSGHLVEKAFKWLYYNTPFGAHPSPAARITAAKKYLEQQKTAIAVESAN